MFSVGEWVQIDVMGDKSIGRICGRVPLGLRLAGNGASRSRVFTDEPIWSVEVLYRNRFGQLRKCYPQCYEREIIRTVSQELINAWKAGVQG